MTTNSLNEMQKGTRLVHPSGQIVTFVDHGTDHQGDYVTVEHQVPRQGPLNGPHWHPELTESFTVVEGSMRFLVDGKEHILHAGERITVLPRQVHQFWNTSEKGLTAIHEIRPPGRHWQMFQVVHKLESEGKMSPGGIPRNPLWLGVAWSCIDGYLAGPPKLLQRIVLGGLAKLARALGYKI
ncbi:cupin domain-containing protein [Paenibacillus daejeonensis]|uniref:cupin domain-containing protein n=1 Tax=Paenibacillus daejeonensis TaxID=135193 RepID=UPI00036AA2D1|nr:cupin domain-containing protein [Paenibacillus daejeonensis]